jgi:hypothetical protein
MKLDPERYDNKKLEVKLPATASEPLNFDFFLGYELYEAVVDDGSSLHKP